MCSSVFGVFMVLAAAAAPARLSAGPPAGRDKTVAGQVRALIDTAAAAKSADEQQAAFDRVLSLGCAAVPALGAALGDARRLPVRYLRLENHATDRFEAFR